MNTESLFFEYLRHLDFIAHGGLFGAWKRGRAMAEGRMTWQQAADEQRLDSWSKWEPAIMEAKQVERASFIEDEHLDYLDQLRASGDTNMFGAVSYVKRAFPELTDAQAQKVLSYWMKTFSSRQS